MAPTDPSHPARRELARRVNGGVEVTLWWDARTSVVTVSVQDRRSGTQFELDVDGDRALDVFHHPYPHAASRGVAYATAGAL
jgi:hypothetical protein